MEQKKKEFSDKQELHYTFSKKYGAIVKLLSGINAKNVKLSDKQQLTDLIKETGYKRLSTLPVY